MFHIVGFSESQDEAGAYTKMAAVPNDQTIKTFGDDIQVPEKLNKVLGVTALLGTAGGDARLVSPSLRRVNPLYATPTIELLVPPSTHPKWIRQENPVPLATDEKLNAENNSDPAAAEQHTVIVALCDGPIAPLLGEIYTAKFTITLALVAGQWTFSQLTLIDDLPVGNYAVVGGKIVCATGVAFRFVPVGEMNNVRPGGLVSVDTDDLEDPAFRGGRLGEWFQFMTTRLPGVEILGSAAAGSATYNGYMDVVAK